MRAMLGRDTMRSPRLWVGAPDPLGADEVVDGMQEDFTRRGVLYSRPDVWRYMQAVEDGRGSTDANDYR
jgi:hypothetical protein